MENTEIRKKISIELCEDLTKRLNHSEKKEIKIGALIAIKNLILETKIEDPILDNCLADTITDNDPQVRHFVLRVIKEAKISHVLELLKIKYNELSPDIKLEISNLIS